MDDLVAFLGARLDEDEAAAKVAANVAGPDWAWHTGVTIDDEPTDYVTSKDRTAILLDTCGSIESEAPHIARHDPARVLREVRVMRAIVDGCKEAAARPYDLSPGVHEGRDDWERSRDEAVLEAMEAVAGALAVIWEDHPDFRPEWKPVTAAS